MAKKFLCRLRLFGCIYDFYLDCLRSFGFNDRRIFLDIDILAIFRKENTFFKGNRGGAYSVGDFSRRRDSLGNIYAKPGRNKQTSLFFFKGGYDRGEKSSLGYSFAGN